MASGASPSECSIPVNPMARFEDSPALKSETFRDKRRLLRRVFRHFVPYRKRILIGFLCMICASLFHVSVYGLIKPTFEIVFGNEKAFEQYMPAKGEPNSDRSGQGIRDRLKERIVGPLYVNVLIPLRNRPWVAVIALGGLMILVVILKGGFTYAQEYLLKWAANRMCADMRVEVYRHIHSLSLDFFSRKGTGTLMAHVTSDIQLFARNLDILSDTLIQPWIILATLVALFFIHPKMTIFAILIVPIAALAIRALGKRVRRASRKLQEYQAGMSSILQETFSATRVVKSFGMEDYEKKRFEEESMRFFRSDMSIVRARSLAPVLTEGLGALAAALVLAGGTYYVLSPGLGAADRLSPGSFTVYVGLVFALYQPIKALSRVSITINNALAGAERVFEVLDTKPKITDREGSLELPPFSDRIVYRNVVFEYAGGVRALDHVSVEIRKGETVALVGPSGAGKSTFVDLLTRFHDPLEGAIEVDGHDLRDVRMASLRRQIGIVPQEVVLFNDTIRSNIAYGRPDLDQSAVERAAREANAHDFIVAMPRGYDTVVGERGHALSGGQAQRVSIARALLKDPPILIFDEATSSLDSESEMEIRKALANLMKSRTTIVIAHRLSTVMHTDRIVVLEEGRIAGVGKHAELLGTCPVYRRLYEHQFGTLEPGADG